MEAGSLSVLVNDNTDEGATVPIAAVVVPVVLVVVGGVLGWLWYIRLQKKALTNVELGARV